MSIHSIVCGAIAWTAAIDRFIALRVKACHASRDVEYKINHSWWLIKLGFVAYACFIISSFTMHSATNQDLSDQQKILVLLISLLLAFYLFALCTHISRASTAHKKGPLQLNEVHDSRKELRMTVIASLAAMCALLISDKANLADISLIIALTLWTYGDYVFATVQQTK